MWCGRGAASGAVVATLSFTLLGCNSDGRSAGPPLAASSHAAAPSESDAPSPLAKPATTVAVPAAVAELASKVSCDSVEARVGDAPDGPPPQSAYDCSVGDEHLSVFTYGSPSDARAAFASLVKVCAPAVGGGTWIVWANTNEAAEAVHERLGGTLSVVRMPC